MCCWVIKICCRPLIILEKHKPYKDSGRNKSSSFWANWHLHWNERVQSPESKVSLDDSDADSWRFFVKTVISVALSSSPKKQQQRCLSKAPPHTLLSQMWGFQRVPLPQLHGVCHLIAWIRKHHVRASSLLLAFCMKVAHLSAGLSRLWRLAKQGESRAYCEETGDTMWYDLTYLLNELAKKICLLLQRVFSVWDAMPTRCNTVSVDPCCRCCIRMCQRLCQWNWIAQLLLLRLLYLRSLACRLTFMHGKFQFLCIFVGMLTCVKQFNKSTSLLRWGRWLWQGWWVPTLCSTLFEGVGEGFD